jgi:hypothetical protein
MDEKPFKFDIGTRATLTESGGTEEGRIIGQARFEHSENQYLIRYRAGDGRQTDAWWDESAMAA